MLKTFTNGIVKENPVLRLILGTCPTLAVTTMAVNGLGMGVAATVVLLGSNIVISLLKNIIPDKVRIPAFITIIAGFVTVVSLLVKAYAPALDAALGIYLPLITVNCIILARAESFASKNKVLPSILDALGMGCGFTAALVLMGSIRELLGNGTIFGLPVTQGHLDPMIVMILPPGGFFVFGLLIALANKLADRKGLPVQMEMACQNCPSAGSCTLLQEAHKGDLLVDGKPASSAPADVSATASTPGERASSAGQHTPPGCPHGEKPGKTADKPQDPRKSDASTQTGKSAPGAQQANVGYSTAGETPAAGTVHDADMKGGGDR